VVAKRVEMGNQTALKEAAALSEEVSKMLTSFIEKVGSKERRQGRELKAES